jgi:hypothetical protein
MAGKQVCVSAARHSLRRAAVLWKLRLRPTLRDGRWLGGERAGGLPRGHQGTIQGLRGAKERGGGRGGGHSSANT